MGATNPSNRGVLLMRIVLILLPIFAMAPLLFARAGDNTPKDVTHEQALRWIHDHRAWRLARKTKPIWARPVTTEEVGKEFQTADHTAQRAKAGAWLCVGSAGEPWFQSDDKKIRNKYASVGAEEKQFSFDGRPHRYEIFKPTGAVQNWVAQVKGPEIKGFSIRPNYDPERPLYSPAGGYVVKDHCNDPYNDSPDDVWLVQQALFESTYEFIK
jgi:hypothetical protein